MAKLFNSLQVFFKFLKNFLEVHDGNFYAEDICLYVDIFGHECHVESLWYNKDENEYYFHLDSDIEMDVKISSLPDYEIERIWDKLREIERIWDKLRHV